MTESPICPGWRKVKEKKGEKKNSHNLDVVDDDDIY